MENKKIFDRDICPICGEGEWIPHSDGVHKFVHRDKEHSVAGMHYAKCNQCESQGFIKGQIKENRRLIQKYEDGILDYISPSNIIKIREIYDISLETAAKIFRTDEQTIQDWESGEAVPSGLETRTLKMVLNNQSEFVALAKEAGVEIEVSHGDESVGVSPWMIVDYQTHVELNSFVSNSWSSFKNARNTTRHLAREHDLNNHWTAPPPQHSLPGYSDLVAFYPPRKNVPDDNMEPCQEWMFDMSDIRNTCPDEARQQLCNQSKPKSKRSHKNREAEAA